MLIYCIGAKNFNGVGLKNVGKQKQHGTVERMWELA